MGLKNGRMGGWEDEKMGEWENGEVFLSMDLLSRGYTGLVLGTYSTVTVQYVTGERKKKIIGGGGRV